MALLSLAISACIFLLSALKLAEALLSVLLVKPIPQRGVASLPALSVVVPARNEQVGLETALASLLGQEYPGLEIVLVDDRSTDGTGEVMDRLAAGRDGVLVARVEELPDGWLRKNHAVHVGARCADGEWLLLTDADVRFEPDALRLAVAHAEREGLDHLSLIPRLDLPGYWLRGFVAFFYAAFLVYRGYYRANLSASGVGVGIGAFNLLRRSAYERVGGYEARAARPDDDLALGSAIKALGLRQRLMLGQDLIHVPWYGSFGEMIRGVEKNVFPALGYSLLAAAGYTLGTLAVSVWPFVGVSLTGGASALLYLGSILAQLATFVLANRFLGWRSAYLAPGYPVYAVLFAGVLVRSTVLALARGGIYWRGTFYPLSMLRRGA